MSCHDHNFHQETTDDESKGSSRIKPPSHAKNQEKRNNSRPGFLLTSLRYSLSRIVCRQENAALLLLRCCGREEKKKRSFVINNDGKVTWYLIYDNPYS